MKDQNQKVKASNKKRSQSDKIAETTISHSDLEANLVDRHTPLVVYIVNKFNPKDQSEFNDYKQQGMLGLLKAIRKHDPEQGKLTTIAWRSIAWEIIRFINKENKHSAFSPIEDDNLYISDDDPNIEDYISDNFSDIEKQILSLKMEGYKNKEISEKLNINKQKVFTHFRSVVNKIKNANQET